MSDRRRILVVSILMMTTVSLIVGWITIWALYRAEIAEKAGSLQMMARAQAHLMEAMARFGALSSSSDGGEEAWSAALSQIVDGHQRLGGFGETGEFVLGRLENERLVFLLDRRFPSDDQQDRAHPLAADRAEPMRRALAGERGWTIGCDYRGETVLAAYRPVAALNVGLVAKCDLSELRAPFLRAGTIAGAAALVVILGGALVNIRISNPLVRRLEESETRVRTILESAVDGIVTADQQGRIESVNRAAEQLFGYTASEIVGHNLYMLMSKRPGDAQSGSLADFVRNRRDRVTGPDREVLGRRKDGTTFPAELALSEARPGGRCVFTAMVRDITERKQAENVLKASLNLNQIMDSSSVDEIIAHGLEEGVRLTDSRIGYFHFVNSDQKTLALYTWSRETLKRCSVSGDNTHYPLEKAGVWVDCIHQRQPVIHNDYESLPHKKGLPAGHVPIQREMAVPVFDNDQIVAVLGVGNKPQDYNQFDIDQLSLFARNTFGIVQRKRAEEALREHATAMGVANEALARANAATREANHALEASVAELARKNADLDEFSHVASHDLQEPLRKLIAFSELLARDLGDDLPGPAAKDLRFITDAAQRMHTLVEDLLRLSRAGREAMQRDLLSLDDCADRALEALARLAEETGAEITRDELPEVIGDATTLTQLYQNLVANALKFVVAGERPVIRFTADRVDGEWVLGVRDNGIGIDAVYAEQIFGPFKRLHRRSDFEGTGIGLAICRKTVERHGGRLWVESKPGQGAHFRFTLNCNPEDQGCESEMPMAHAPLFSS